MHNKLTDTFTPDKSDKFKWKGVKTIDPETDYLQEAIIGENNLKKIWWLDEALKASKKIVRITKNGHPKGTGFMISPTLMMTNNHVLANPDQAKSVCIQFDYRDNKDLSKAKGQVWKCNVKKVFLTNKHLDYTIVSLAKRKGKIAGDVWGYFDISNKVDLIENQRLNIIQHPGGGTKEIAFRDNQLKKIKSDRIHYLTDTKKGSSGSPVLDDDFNVIALHSRKEREPKSKRWYRNTGFLINKIYPEIKKYL